MPEEPIQPATSAEPATHPQPIAALPVLAYATPGQFQSEVGRDGRYVVVPHGMDLPPYCFSCGKPAEEFIAANFFLVLQLRDIKLQAGLCAWHGRLYRTLGRVFGCLFIASGVALIAAFVLSQFGEILKAWDEPAELVVGMVLVVMGFSIGFGKWPRQIWCQHYNATDAWIGGESRRYLQHLSPVERGKRTIFTTAITYLFKPR